MTWFGWVLIAWFVFDAAMTVAFIGKKRVPLTPPMALWVLAFLAAIIVGLLAVGTGHL